MKKLLSIAVCVSEAAAFATDVLVPLGDVGVTAITSSTTNTIVAVSYTDLASDGNITASNLVKTSNLTVGDRLYVYDSGNFKAFELALSGSVKYWQGTATVEPKDGIASLVAATSADSVRVAVGTGVWLVRGSGWDGNPFTFYIYGKPVDSLSPVSVSGSALVGNPTQVSKAPTVATPQDGDKVIAPDGAGKMQTYIYSPAVSTTSHGVEVTIQAGWYLGRVKPSTTPDGLPAIPAGTGFWYVPKTAGATISW